MAAHTIAQFRAVEVQPAALSLGGVDGHVMWEYTMFGHKGITVVAADTIDIFNVVADTGIVLTAASLETKIAGVATATMDIQIAPGGTPADVTGFTAWALDAAVGTNLVKFATAANTANHTADTVIRVQINTAGLGAGEWVIRIYGLNVR